MLVFAAVLSVAMNAASVELVPAPKASSPEVVNFEAPPQSVSASSDDARVKRFIGAFTGGVVGLGAALALMPLGDGFVPGCATCISALHVTIGAFAPLFALGGAWLAFELLGGDAGLLTPVIALAPALLASLGLLAIAREAGTDGVTRLLPYLISSGILLAGGAALALDFRARQLSELGLETARGKAPVGRVVLTSLITTLTGAVTVIASGLILVAARSSELGAVAMVTSALVGSVGVAAAGWGVHKANQGRGSFLAALTGLGLGVLVSGAGLGLFALAQGGFSSSSALRNTTALTMLVELGVVSAALGPVLGLELSHTAVIEASLPRVTFGASPTPNGGMLAAGVRF